VTCPDQELPSLMEKLFLFLWCVASCRGNTYPNQATTNCRVSPVTVYKGTTVTHKECAQIEQETWDPIEQTTRRLPGACRWQADAAGNGDRSVCMCPATHDTCTANGRTACFWHRDNACVSVAERFYYQFAALLSTRGKKDFSLKVQYGAVPARGRHLPYGVHGPAQMGMGSHQPGLPPWMMLSKPNPLQYLANPFNMMGGYGGGMGGLGGYGGGMMGYGGYGQSPYGQSQGYGQGPSYGATPYVPSPYGQSPAYGAQPFGQAQAYGAQPPAYGALPPAQPPAYGSQPPAYTAQPPTYGAQPPTYGAQPPAYGAQPPAYGAQPATPAQPQAAGYQTKE